MDKDQLDKLMAESETMTQELVNMRNSVLNQTCASDYPFSSDMFENACQHRQLLRRLADTLEANRKLAQLNKEKVERSRVMLQGIEYFKKTLRDKIQSYHTDVESIDQYFDEPIGHIDWEKNYESGERRLKESLEKLKMKDQMYRTTINNRIKLQKQIDDKSKLFNVVMPKQVKKLNNQVLEMTKLFGIEANQGLEKIQNTQIAYIFDIFKTLKRVEKLEIKLTKEQYENIDLVIKPSCFDFYERALQYGIKLEEKQIKIRISCMKPEFPKLVIGVDRRSDFSNLDIFHRLINREDSKPVFSNPTNQSQRNVNNKFVFVDWLESCLCIDVVKCSSFVQLVKARVFSTALTKYIFDSLRNPVWLSTVAPAVYSEISSRRILFETIQKISFTDYKSLVPLNNIIKKSLIEYDQRTLKKDRSHEDHIQYLKNRTTFIQYLQRLGLEQLIVPEIYSYYKLVITYKMLKAVCVVMVPLEYPDLPPKVKMISLEKVGEDLGESGVGAQCKMVVQSKLFLTREMDVIEKEANSPFSMLNEGTNDPFRLVYYLSKLLNSIYAVQNILIERTKNIK